MGLDEDRLRLIEAARDLVARGDTKFTISAVCAGAGVDRSAFHRFFSGKRALLAALETPAALQPQSTAPIPAPERDPEAATSEPGVSTPDAWLERRLRVFERALAALEAKAERDARAHSAAIARLEEKIAALETAQSVNAPVLPEPAPPAPPAAVPRPRPAPDLLPLAPAPVLTAPSKEKMAEALQAARAKAAPVNPSPRRRRRRAPLRWLAWGALTTALVMFCAGLTLGYSAAAHTPGQGISHRRMASGAARTLALADAGDPRAQLSLAMSYLRGGDSEGAARWGLAAADSGLAMAQYLAGALMQDKARAFALFRAAASQGNLKAMHNLAIAYAEGQGTVRSEAQAADWFARAAAHGYVDSAFDLAVLYERGSGVKQDLQQALKWYSVAALANDAPSRQRADFLRGQLSPAEIEMAEAAARSFSPLPPANAAN